MKYRILLLSLALLTSLFVNQSFAQENKEQQVTGSQKTQKPFNKKPFEDFAAEYGGRILSKEINLNSPYSIEVVGGIDEAGKLTNAKMLTADGSDQKMVGVAKDAIAAISDSGLLKPYYDAGARNAKIIFIQAQDNFQALIQTQFETEDFAKRFTSAIKLAFSVVRTLRKGSDEAILIDKAQIEAAGKISVIKFLISNEEKNQILEKSLKESRKTN